MAIPARSGESNGRARSSPLAGDPSAPTGRNKPRRSGATSKRGGELITLQHAQLRAQVDEAIRLERDVAALQKKHEGVFLGVGLASMQGAKALVAGWQLGFIHSARVTSPDPGADADFNSVETLTMLLRHPSGRFIRDLTLGLPDHKVHMDYTDLVRVLTQWVPKTLNRLFTRPNGLPRPSRACLSFGRSRITTRRSGRRLVELLLHRRSRFPGATHLRERPHGAREARAFSGERRERESRRLPRGVSPTYRWNTRRKAAVSAYPTRAATSSTDA